MSKSLQPNDKQEGESSYKVFFCVCLSLGARDYA